MELCTGIDMVEIARVKKAMAHPRFLLRFYGERERGWLKERGNPPQSAAACFCAKEAFSKALGTGLSGFCLREVELLHENSGRPYLAFSGRVQRLVRECGMRFEISVTHTKDTAAAVVIGWRVTGQADAT